jgi:hypothetical protein
MISTERTGALAASLRADGYDMAIDEVSPEGGESRISVVISATPQACADCLVPKDLMRGILSQALGVEGDTLDLTYPKDLPENGS